MKSKYKHKTYENFTFLYVRTYIYINGRTLTNCSAYFVRLKKPGFHQKKTNIMYHKCLAICLYYW